MSTAQLDPPEAIKTSIDEDDPNFVKPDPDVVLRPLVPLLIEYTEKLRDLTWADTPKRRAKVDLPVKTALYAAKKLAQFVSQRLSRPTDEVFRMELELRLAEYEMVYTAAKKRILGT